MKFLLDRRELLSRGATTAILAGTSVPAIASPMVRPGGDVTRASIDQGTNIAVAVSRDGTQLAFDLGGVIWQLPAGGGTAMRLTDEMIDGTQPEWMADGQSIVFQSYRTGNFHLWSVAVRGGALTQLTFGDFDCREPAVAPDGRRIAYVSDEDGTSRIHVLDTSSRQSIVWARTPGQASQPSWSPDGKRIVFCVDGRQIMVVAQDGTATEIAATPRAKGPLLRSLLAGPAFAPDGKVAMVRIGNAAAGIERDGQPMIEGEDVFPFRPRWLADGSMIYTADGEIRRRAPGATRSEAIAFKLELPATKPSYRRAAAQSSSSHGGPVIGIGSPMLSPDAKKVAFRALNALWVMDIGKPPRKLHDSGACVIDPAWSPDGSQLAFACDKSGHFDIWLCDLATGAERRLTTTTAAAMAPGWSPDGRAIAFLDQDGALHSVDLNSGAITALQSAIWQPGRPSWGPGGRTIAMAAFRPTSQRFREGTNQLLTIDVATKKATYQPIAPNKSIATRGDDGPVWSPDGRMMAFVFASLLHICPVAPDGTLSGPMRCLNNEVTDAPSWSGDSSQILYLSSGKLRLIDVASGRVRTLPLRLNWAAPKRPPRLIVRAGRFWNGHDAAVRPNVDIVIAGDRIAAVAPAEGDLPRGNPEFVDATSLTAMPGLVDAHIHLQMRNAGLGDREGRLWLAMGITAVRSPGGAAYHAIEYREAIASGQRIGPRSFVTGEAIDGSRIFYNMMRPVTEPDQLDRELERAAALGYDLMKCYVRLPMALQQKVVRWAHAQGLPVASHYLYPSAFFGIDSMEHMGASNKLGYSQSVSQTGSSYRDVSALMAGAGMALIPTLFQASALYRTDRSLVDDARVRTLLPSWETARLDHMIEGLSDDDVAAQLKMVARNVAQLQRLQARGAPIVSGTDAPLDFAAISLHMNLRAMVRFGMSPRDALVTATRNAGKLLGQPLGVIEPGAWADITLTHGNPLERIEHAADVAMVVANGKMHDIASLIAPFQTRPDQSHRRIETASNDCDPRYWWHSRQFLDNCRQGCCSASHI